MILVKLDWKIYVVIASFCVGMFLGYVFLGGLLAGERSELEQQYQVFSNVYSYVNNFYFDEDGIDDEKMLHGAFTGFIEALDDCPVKLLDERAYDSIRDASEETEEAVGLYLTTKNDTLIIGPPKSNKKIYDPDYFPFDTGYFTGNYYRGVSGEPAVVFKEIFNVVAERCELEPAKKFQAAISGMLGSLEDPHTQHLDQRSYQEMQTSTEQQFGGLGIQISMEDDELIVIAPMSGTPAMREGLMPGDRIKKIDGEDASKLDGIEAAVDRLRGEPDSEVTLLIGRSGMEPFEVTIIREIISVESVYHSLIERDGHKLGFLRINNFGEKTAGEVKDALAELHEKGMEGLVLDLRNNPGGILRAANDVADIWIDDGKIVYTSGRIGEHDMNVWARADETEGDYPMFVVVNEGSASGSEIVAGALRDHSRAIVAGDTTFGKASVQSVFPLPDRSALKITTASYFTPEGYKIEGRGISPHRAVRQDAIDTPIQKEMRKLQMGDTVIDFVRNYPEPSEEDIELFVEELREQGFTLPEKYIRHQIKNQQYATRGEELVVDLATDPQLDNILSKLVNALRVDPWNIEEALALLSAHEG